MERGPGAALDAFQPDPFIIDNVRCGMGEELDAVRAVFEDAAPATADAQGSGVLV